MKIVCLRCNTEFTESRALTTHKTRHCKTTKAALGTKIAKRKAQEDADREGRHKRRREKREEEAEHMLVDEPVSIFELRRTGCGMAFGC